MLDWVCSNLQRAMTLSRLLIKLTKPASQLRLGSKERGDLCLYSEIRQNACL